MRHTWRVDYLRNSLLALRLIDTDELVEVGVDYSTGILQGQPWVIVLLR